MENVQCWAGAECTDFGECSSAELYSSFSRWVVANRTMRRLCGRTAFGEALKLAGYSKIRKGGETYWTGIELKRKDSEG